MAGSPLARSTSTGFTPQWQEDDEVKTCNACDRSFKLTRRRHHCRCCGKIFCHQCSRDTAAVLKYGYKDAVRVCRQCKVSLEDAEKEKWAKYDKVKDFDLLVFLGEGAFGKVYKVRHKASARVFAMKVVEKAKLQTKQELTAMRDEKLLLQTLDHPYIVKLHFTFQTHDKLFMIMDFLSGGDCYYLMTKTRFPEAVVRVHAGQIALALDYLHQQRILYRDLKPENCVLDAEGNMMLTDFGLAKVAEGARARSNTQVGTPDYWAPEMFRGHEYSKSIDWWALGCLIYELITGRHPFLDQRGTVPQSAVVNDPPNLTEPGAVPISDPCRVVVLQLLNKDPERRLQDFVELKRTEWFAGMDWDALFQRRLPLPGNWRPPTTETFDPSFTAQTPQVVPSTPTERFHFDDFTWRGRDGLAAPPEL